MTSWEPPVRITTPGGADHLVAPAVLVSTRDGRLLARCGQIVVSASMAAEEGRLCPLCAAYASARRAPRPSRARASGRRG